MSIAISQLSFEHHRNALGIAETEPRISWRFEGNAENWVQTSYDIEVARGNSRRRSSFDSTENLFVDWPSDPLESTEQASIRVRAHGKRGQSSTPWSDWVAVETGLLAKDDWSGAVPIAAERETESGEAKRPVYFRKEFQINQSIESARLYITGLGLYEAEINGKRVGDSVLAPGFQSYQYRHVYDTYDITHMVNKGKNAIGVVVGEGWFLGTLFGSGREFWGDTIGLVSLIKVTLKNGKVVTIPTDDSWAASLGPIVSSEIYNGETYDSRLEADIKGWSTSGFNAKKWLKTKELGPLNGTLSSPDGPPLRRLEQKQVERIFESPKGNTLVDFGQNLVGWVRLTVEGPSGTNITLKHAEVIDSDGELALTPLRTAKATDSFILNGKGSQTLEPHFTYHGFRYVQVTGWPKNVPLTKESLTAIVIHSDMEQTGQFECSHDLLNQFHDNVRWSLKGNFFSIPTDCPQRDERMGWTGDAHAFGPTANFLYNTAGFWRGWHKDIWSEMQTLDNVVPWIIPTVPPGNAYPAAAVWGDVAVANPWNLYKAFGDENMLEEQYDQAYHWVDSGIPKKDDGLWSRDSFQWGDWLDPLAPEDNPGGATTSAYLVADAYLVRMTEVLANISDVLGKSSKAEKYRTQHDTLRTAFQTSWITDGKLANTTQTAYALALDFGLYTDSDESETAAETLRTLVKDNDYLVGTGFAGTPALGPALRSIGSTEYFYEMLLSTSVPSWLFQVVMGGTTTWERWDSMYANGTVNKGEMTSFNHYAFGSVANWIHETIGGLAPAEPGWKVIDVAPVPGGNITSADTTFVSGYGKIRAKWWISKGKFNLNLWVPPNSKARVTLPQGGSIKTVGSGFHTFQQSSYKNYGN